MAGEVPDMEILIVLVVVGLLAVVGMAVVGRGRSDVAEEDTPDRTQVTDTDVQPEPGTTMPGTADDRARKGAGAAPGRAGVAKRKDR